ncbi:MAG: GNAT family N-acetyltransferase [Betaproteobacteria bacterium]|nr:GNAT family N-acetyltransferase [Betaproteobacteria bacterium]
MKADTALIHTIRLERWEDLSGLESEWNDLLDRSPGHSIFQTFPWHICWWRVFGGSHELLVILGYADARLAAIAPMMITRGKDPLGRTQNHVCFIGGENHASDYCDFIIDPEIPGALEALLENLCTRSTAYNRIDLSNLPGHSPNHAGILEYFKRRSIKAGIEYVVDAPVRILGDRQADIKAANKSSLKRHTGFFRKSGELRFHRCGSEEEILGYLEQFFEQHKSRWARTASPSQFFNSDQRNFYRELVREVFPHGWLRFDVVLFDGAPLAFHFGFEYRRCFIWYKPAFDIRFASRSPGEVLIKFLLEDAIEKRLAEFDFTVGSESFKYRFANQVRSVNRIIAFRHAGDFWIYEAVRRGKSMLKTLLGRNAAPGAGSASPRQGGFSTAGEP